MSTKSTTPTTVPAPIEARPSTEVQPSAIVAESILITLTGKCTWAKVAVEPGLSFSLPRVEAYKRECLRQAVHGYESISKLKIDSGMHSATLTLITPDAGWTRVEDDIESILQIDAKTDTTEGTKAMPWGIGGLQRTKTGNVHNVGLAFAQAVSHIMREWYPTEHTPAGETKAMLTEKVSKAEATISAMQAAIASLPEAMRAAFVLALPEDVRASLQPVTS